MWFRKNSRLKFVKPFMTLIETPMGNTIETHEDLHYGFHQGFIYGLHRCLNQNLMYGLHPGLIYGLQQGLRTKE
ncbi:hypothetical protein PV326_005123 [Microctonus aethiopoides]|nr:hypothetical protein PV326_005123 [Microctonus aethiopoides]